MTPILKRLKYLSCERGSISILTLTMLLIMMVASFLVINISASYLSQRELIHITEPILSRASNNLDMNVYYSVGMNSVVPIDCVRAYESFRSEIEHANLRGEPIIVVQWNCAGGEISAEVESKAKYLISASLIGKPSEYRVKTLIGAHSKVRMI